MKVELDFEPLVFHGYVQSAALSKLASRYLSIFSLVLSSSAILMGFLRSPLLFKSMIIRVKIKFLTRLNKFEELT